MGHPLDSAFLKLSRAAEHLQEIQAQTKAFIDTNPYITSTKWDFDTGEHSVVVRVSGDPPARLGLIAADILQNTRSALDHLVYELADLDPAVPRGEKTQYPIFDTPDKFDSMLPRYLEGVRGEHRAKLRNTQPYNPRYALFLQLRDLNDWDKHRALQPMVAMPKLVDIRAGVPNVVRDIRVVARGKIYLKDQTVVATFRADREVAMQYTLGFIVGFGGADRWIRPENLGVRPDDRSISRRHVYSPCKSYGNSTLYGVDNIYARVDSNGMTNTKTTKQETETEKARRAEATRKFAALVNKHRPNSIVDSKGREVR